MIDAGTIWPNGIQFSTMATLAQLYSCLIKPDEIDRCGTMNNFFSEFWVFLQEPNRKSAKFTAKSV